jgi:hypothetical protein
MRPYEIRKQELEASLERTTKYLAIVEGKRNRLKKRLENLIQKQQNTLEHSSR